METNGLETKEKPWSIIPSKKARRTTNPVRVLVDNLTLEPNKDKEFIALSIGDPTIFGNLPPNNNVVEQALQAIKSGKFNGYGPSFGHLCARESVANFVRCADFKPDPKNVIMASGCSSALEMAITAVADPGDNILIPRPGFPLYRVICQTHDIQTKSYDLLEDKGWEVDLNHMDSQIDDKTRAILINNPSNPCGSVFSREHMRQIAQIAERHRLPVIADEVYAYMVFKDEEFVWFAEVATNIPVLSCGGTAKTFLVPGWRIGWIVIFDRLNCMEELRKGIISLSQVIVGPNTIIQGALPKIISDTPEEFFQKTTDVIEGNANAAYECLKTVKEIKPIMPKGAMYMLCCIDLSAFPDIDSDLDFVSKLVQEESVFVLPGKCFDYPNSFRVVLTVPENKLSEACQRIRDFCVAHSNKKKSEDSALSKKQKLSIDE